MIRCESPLLTKPEICFQVLGTFRYFVGRLGLAKIAVLKSKEVAEDGSPMWDVLLQEASGEPRRKPEAKEEAQPEAQAAAAPYSAKQLPDDAIPF